MLSSHHLFIPSENVSRLFPTFISYAFLVRSSVAMWKKTAYSLTQAGLLLGLFFDPDVGGNMFFPKRRLTFNRLHGIISQKTELFTEDEQIYILKEDELL
jgi:hypothetical protein